MGRYIATLFVTILIFLVGDEMGFRFSSPWGRYLALLLVGLFIHSLILNGIKFMNTTHQRKVDHIIWTLEAFLILTVFGFFIWWGPKASEGTYHGSFYLNAGAKVSHPLTKTTATYLDSGIIVINDNKGNQIKITPGGVSKGNWH